MSAPRIQSSGLSMAAPLEVPCDSCNDLASAWQVPAVLWLWLDAVGDVTVYILSP